MAHSDIGKDEIDFFRMASVLWKRKLLIIAFGFVGAVIGGVVGIFTKPTYSAECVLAPNTSQGTGAPSALSQLGWGGGVGGLLGSRMGGSSLDRLELLVASRDLAVSLIDENDMLPKLFPERWDSTRRKWKEGKKPTSREGADYLKSSVLSVQQTPKNNALILSVEIYDSTLARDLVEAYMRALEKDIRDKIRSDADSNRKYLENQLSSTSDPVLRERVQDLIGAEIEKTMLVSSRSLEIIEGPVVPLARSAPNMKKIVVISFLLGAIFSSLWILVVTGIRAFRKATVDGV